MLAIPHGLSMEVQLCVEGEGSIDPGALAAAAAIASEACPGARLVQRGKQWVDSGRPPAVHILGAAEFDRQRLDSSLLRKQLARDRSPSCELLLVQDSPATLVFRALHGVMDGSGARLWLQELFRALRGETVHGTTSRATLDEVMRDVAARHGLDDLPPAAGFCGRPWRSPLGNVPLGPRRSLWRRRTIDGIHPAVSAKVIRRVATYGGAQGPVRVPVDLRQYLPELRLTGLANGAIKMTVDEGEDWSAVHARLLDAMSRHEYLTDRDDPSLMERPLPLLRSFYRWIDDKSMKNPDFMGAAGFYDTAACVSHVGAVDLADFSAGDFRATSYYSLGGTAFSPEIDIAESAGRTEVTVAWRDGPGAVDRVEGLLDQIEEDLSPRRYRVWDGNLTDREAPPATLTSLFAEQVRRTPEAVAVRGDNGDMSYAELDRRAAEVAAALRVRGIGRDDRVGVVSGRSPSVIVAVWGVLKAGAAYLPIPPDYPDARISQLLTAAGVRACLLEPPVARRGFLPAGCEGIDLSAVPRQQQPCLAEDDVRPGDLAYVVFTSGSTGTPKGVEIEHRSVVSYVRWAIREGGIDASTRMLLIPSISFDVAGCAFFLPLLAGGAVLPVREVNAVTLREAIETSGATAMAVTPSHLELISQAGVRGSTMRVVMSIGEVLRRSTALRAREVLGPRCRILNQWGPAETTIVNTSHEFDPVTDTQPGVPFGRPMDNNRIYLLDSLGRFVPPQEPGEVYVGGGQLARGYLGRPDLTRQRFSRLADGTRVYRTGDIAQLLPTGELTFISRVDDQVKIAGHRIEPAEVAQALEDHPGVRQAAVIPRMRPGRMDKELCGYVVADGDITQTSVKEFLADRLPAYMVPAVIRAVPEIPRNANGKTDASQLPDPFAALPGGGFDPADCPALDGDDVSAAVTAVWSRLLRVEPRSIDEQADFHQLGGNSLLLLSMVREVTRSVLDDETEQLMDRLVDIIRQPTLGRVCDLVRQASS